MIRAVIFDVDGVLIPGDVFSRRFFFSCDLGVAKPDREFYERVTRSLALEPSEILSVDDHPANVEAAREHGGSACHTTSADEVERALKRFA